MNPFTDVVIVVRRWCGHALTATALLLLLSQILSAQGIIQAKDVEFHTLRFGVDTHIVKSFNFCNVGDDELTFFNPNDFSGKSIIEWDDHEHFIIPPEEIERLKTMRMPPRTCEGVRVIFKQTGGGTFRAKARIWSSTRNERDTSIWYAEVVEAMPDLLVAGLGETWVTRKEVGNCTKDTVRQRQTFIQVLHDGPGPIEIASIELLGSDAEQGFIRLDTSNRATTIRPGDILQPQDYPFQNIIITPVEERLYTAQVRIASKEGDTLTGSIHCLGVESHLGLVDTKFDSVEFTGAYPLTPARRRTIMLRALPSRQLTITGVKITGPDAADFWIDPKIASAFPISLLPGESYGVDVEFRPTGIGLRTAELEVMGDHALCDDSTSLLEGMALGSSGVTGAPAAPASSVEARGIGGNRFEIACSIPRPQRTRVEINDALGRSIATLSDGTFEAGMHHLHWDASGEASGVYYCRVIGDGWSRVERLIVTR